MTDKKNIIKLLYVFIVAGLLSPQVVCALPLNAPAMPIHESETALYSKKLLSLNFQNISIRSLLQLLAEFVDMNIIISNAVTGNISLHLDHISWDQAFAIILQSQGLAKQQFGNVLFVAPIDEISLHQKQALAAQQQLEDITPLHSELLQIKYGKASEISTLLKSQASSLLSARGSVSADARTNTLWIEDTPRKLIEMHHFIDRLDVPVRQVLIEGRIVNIDKSCEKELGIRYVFNNPVSIDGPQPTRNMLVRSDNQLNQHLNVDLPVDKLLTTGTVGVGLALARLGSGSFLDLELAALESAGSGQIISSPRLVTADQQAAQIQAGEEIPYQQSTSSGATNVAFKNVALSLIVTPQITPNDKIILTLKVNQDKVGARSVLGVPSIDTRQIETQVLVNDGETIVLGGIYETDNNNQVYKLPFFGSLPWIGALFRQKLIRHDQRELLIFVTPHILKDPIVS